MPHKEKDFSVIGKRQPKLDGPLKTKGRSQFTDDIELSGMLYGKIVRSPIARGRIININTTRAESLSGVKAVITNKDCPGVKVSPDRLLLCSDRVNFIGDEVAAVAAIDEDTAAEAAELIKVEYEPLTAVFSFEDATAKDAPVIHDECKNNSLDEYNIDFGNVDKAFAEADHVRIGECIFNPNHNCFAEHHVVIADYSLPGKLSIWTPNQSPLYVQKSMGGVLGISESNVRVFNLNTGGAFSGRIGPRQQSFIAAILSQKASRPVKIRCDADEEFVVYPGGGYFKYIIKTGVMKDGTIKATEATYLFDCGAYWNFAFNVLLRCKYHLIPQVYHMEAMRWNERAVYTNNPPNMYPHGAAFLQLKLAQETELDLIAKEIGMDPMELKLKNAVAKGDTTLTNIHYASCGLKESIKKAAKKASWKKKFGKLPPYRGIGIGCGAMNSGGPDKSGALIKIGEDGKLSLFVGLPDMGQGSHTAMAMIAAETLGVTIEDVEVVAGDTNSAPFDIGAFGQRGTFFTGNAVRLACLDAKKQLASSAAKKLGVKPSQLIFCDRKIFPAKAPEQALLFKDIVSETLHSKDGKHIMGKGFYHTSSPTKEPWVSTLAYSFGAQVAEVEVDPDTGIVILLKVTHAHDVGRAINPLAIEGQIDGQVFSGMGQILSEECIMEKGKVLNPSWLDYRIGRSFEVPELEYDIIETNDPYGPYGAKEVGEGPIVCTMAIANAVNNAIGIPVREYPITPERVLHAIKEKSKK
ncbi:MAG: xanthine dehydrogenase family protein molybdopterin-binding subunit [Proteobacteria bacterium]|nr:xanthine dehydrogenase family protein molybdopterin-binding subunit [Pseudomonadota bacterium]